MYTNDGEIGCTVCSEVKNLGVKVSRGINISIQRVIFLLIVAQKKLSSHHFEKRSMSTKTPKHIRKLLVFLKQCRKTYCSI